MSPLTSHTQLMKRLPVHTKSVLSGSMTASFTQKQPSDPPELQTGLFSLKERRGKTEEVPKMAYNVWEKEAADINLKLSQLGFTPR